MKCSVCKKKLKVKVKVKGTYLCVDCNAVRDNRWLRNYEN
jgi:hypothetical protein